MHNRMNTSIKHLLTAQGHLLYMIDSWVILDIDDKTT